MPAAPASTTSQRLLALLSLMQTPRTWSAPTLAARLGVGERTVRRDVERLRELGYAVATTRGPEGGYRLAAGEQLPPLLLDDEQAVAVAIALRTAAAAGAGIDEAADRALRTIGRLLPDRLARRVGRLEIGTASAGPAPAPVDPDVLLRLGEAIQQQVEIRFDYASPADEEARAGSPAAPAAQPGPARRAEPHHLLLRGGRWYLVAWAPERDDWRTFRVDRLDLHQHTGRSFEPRTVPGGDPAAFLSARAKGSTGADAWPCTGSVVLRLPVAQVAPYVHDGTVERLDDERCRVELGSWSWRALAARVAGHDGEVESAEPAELRAAFAQLAERFARAPTRPPG